MPYRAQYSALARPAWPPTPARMKRIYATIARAIHGPNHVQKTALLNAIAIEVVNFDAGYPMHLATQAAYDAWHNAAIARITGLPFTWTDAAGGVHVTLSFGAAQKFLNLVLKDWWAIAPNGINPATLVDRLHGPLDQIVYACTSRFVAELPSLHGPHGTLRSYVKYLTPADYLAYQVHLNQVAIRLSAGLYLPRTPYKIEIEQLLWGWI